MTLRVRFAPSPTGELHVGGARTALFNWLWARKADGTFVLRIEDTDPARSQRAYARGILSALSWLGLNWDELHYQSDRLDAHRRHVAALVGRGLAYHCYCTPQELAARRQTALAQGRAPEYDGHCRDLSESQRRAYTAQGRRPAVRFRVPEAAKTAAFPDFLRGEVRFRRLTTGDFVIQKSDGTPTYNLACVVDDHQMEITHVLRAEDHLSNTPKQLWLYDAFGWQPPQFGHLSIILGPDRRKLSKRHGATSVEALRAEGFLPQAVVNHLALLGWSPGTEEEVFALDELVERFSLQGINLAPQVFDREKLRWLNRQHLARLPADELVEEALPFLDWLGEDALGDRDRLAAALAMVRPSISTLQELRGSAADGQGPIGHPDLASVYRRPRHPPAAMAELAGGPARRVLTAVLAELPPAVDREAVRPMVKRVASRLGLNPRDVFHPLRLALTGSDHGPELATICELLGAEELRQRIQHVLALLEDRG
ncbi:MAG: glutamate--tRNA ligase [Candidatus Bipolaricaulaceae bacterium]